MVLILAEVVIDFVLPFILPDHFYLNLYLTRTARERTYRFQNDADEFLIYDSAAGWRSRPGVEHGKWRIDAQGARTTHDISTDRKRDGFVIFLGSSLTNGGTQIENSETISAYIEDSTLDSVNFAAMLYSPDQSYLTYKYRLKDYQANFVVVGIRLPDDLDGLMNQYLPFRTPDENRIPYFKPRFKLVSDQLELIPSPPQSIYGELLSDSAILKKYDGDDQFNGEFQAYKHTGFLPLSGSAYFVYKKVNHLIRLVRGNYGPFTLMSKLITETVTEANGRGAKVIFMILPDMETTDPTGWRKYLPDHYGRMVAMMRNGGYNIVDAREVFRKSEVPVTQLFFDDHNHYSSKGNQLIASELKSVINGLK